MPAITSENRAAWQGLIDTYGPARPHQGKRVRVLGGRKHVGREGVVTRHMQSRYANTRYMSEAQGHLRDILGRRDWVCRVREDDGSEFWVNAEHVAVVGL